MYKIFFLRNIIKNFKILISWSIKMSKRSFLKNQKLQMNLVNCKIYFGATGCVIARFIYLFFFSEKIVKSVSKWKKELIAYIFCAIIKMFVRKDFLKIFISFIAKHNIVVFFTRSENDRGLYQNVYRGLLFLNKFCACNFLFTFFLWSIKKLRNKRALFFLWWTE